MGIILIILAYFLFKWSNKVATGFGRAVTDTVVEFEKLKAKEGGADSLMTKIVDEIRISIDTFNFSKDTLIED